MTPYSVLVADDSAFMRKIISDFIVEDPKFRIIDTARNGKEAVEKIVRLQPDVVTMDVEMPEMNGLEALRETMRLRPTPIIMLSSLTMEGAAHTIQALEWGAFDFVAKPSGSISLDLYKVKQLLLEKLNAAVLSRNLGIAPPSPPEAKAVVGKQQAPLASRRTERVSRTDDAEPFRATPSDSFPHQVGNGSSTYESIPHQVGNGSSVFESFSHLVAIGTSTGGPRALHHVLSQLPAGFPAPVLVVQHMPPNFTKSLAQRLNTVSGLQIAEAEDGMIIKSGCGYIAPGGWHMTVVAVGRGLRIRLSKEEPRSGHRPSVDMLFESLLPLSGYKRHLVLMTGMGSDGAKTMAALRAGGAETTIAEAEETCVVYGMPRAAVEVKAAMYILAQTDIAHKLIQVTAK